MSEEHEIHHSAGSATPTPTTATLKPSSPSPPNNPLERKLEARVDDDCDGIDDADGEVDEEDGAGSGVEAALSLEPGTVKNQPLSTPEPLVSMSTTTATATTTTATKASDTTKNAQKEEAAVPEEYKNGYILCQNCGLQVDIRDRATGEFTVSMWEEHRERCFPGSSSTARGVPASAAVQGDLKIYTLKSPAHPPTKRRRRAKRTEEERIIYLKTDLYVAQLEAYRVLCALCDKWIRLRPNSTYCSIPWDAHRKSCLAKKISNKSAYALDQRSALFSKDPDIRKFDAERVLCNWCNQWLAMPPEDHHNAVQKWLNHRAECSKNLSSSSGRTIIPKTEIPRTPPLPEKSHQLAEFADMKHNSRQPPTASAHPNANSDEELDELMPDPDAEADGANNDEGAPSPAHGHNTRASGRRKVKPSPSSSSSSDYDEDGEGDVDADVKREAKRRRLDGPSSSSSRSYLAHHPPDHSRLGPVSSSSSSNVKGSSYHTSHPLHPQTENYASPYTLDRTNGFGRRASGSEVGWRNVCEYSHHAYGHPRHGGSRPGTGYSSTSSSSRRVQQQAPPHHQSYQQRNRERERQWDHDMDHEDLEVADVDAEGEVVDDVDAEGEVVEVEGGDSYVSRPISSSANGHHHTPNGLRDGEHGERDVGREKHVPGGVWTRAPSYYNAGNSNGGRTQERPMAVVRRPLGLVELADLDSVGGRKHFLASSILHLFTTTYESTDDLPISSLLTYLNAAMPVDKHEDFDTAEVVKYVVALSGMPAGSARGREGGGNGSACGYRERIGDRGWRVVLEGDIVRIVD